MKLHVLSDLHNEFSRFDPIESSWRKAEVIVLAGDIDKGSKGIQWGRGAFPDKQIIYVTGNHEFYGHQRANMLAELRVVARQCGVHLLENDSLIIEGVRFLGCTLWTDFKLHGEKEKIYAMRNGQTFLRDFQVIHEGERGHFTPSHSIELHDASLSWLEAELARPFDGKTVVVTHHLPSMRSVALRFVDETLSACFASELERLFGKMDLWIHGHTHDNFDYTTEHGTRVVCNPRGYVTYNGAENADFDPKLIVEV